MVLDARRRGRDGIGVLYDAINFAPAILIMATVLILAVTGIGCKQDQATTSQKPAGIEKDYRQGPVEVVLETDQKTITIADMLNLSIAVLAESKDSVKLPEFDEKVGDFSIKSSHQPVPELEDDGRVRYEKSLILEPFLAGTYTIPALDVTVTRPDKDAAAPLTIRTEPVQIEVKSVLPADAKPALHEIQPPVSLPGRIYWWIAGAAAAALLLIGGFFGFSVYRKRKAGSILPEARPPHEIARAALRDLLARDLLEQGAYKAFYLELSVILRRYIENRFALKAPEQTTPEFLTTMKSADNLAAEHKQLLRRFLEHSDLVKFAKYHPASQEIKDAIDIVERFIDDTAYVNFQKEVTSEREAHHAV